VKINGSVPFSGGHIMAWNCRSNLSDPVLEYPRSLESRQKYVVPELYQTSSAFLDGRVAT
jgi:hypothetical protein